MVASPFAQIEAQLALLKVAAEAQERVSIVHDKCIESLHRRVKHLEKEHERQLDINDRLLRILERKG